MNRKLIKTEPIFTGYITIISNKQDDEIDAYQRMPVEAAFPAHNDRPYEKAGKSNDKKQNKAPFCKNTSF
jgi:hypothetical protein